MAISFRCGLTQQYYIIRRWPFLYYSIVTNANSHDRKALLILNLMSFAHGYTNVAKEVFKCDMLYDVWIVSNIEDILTQAQRQIVEQPFEATGLYLLLSSLFDLSDSLVLWYSSDYQDLDCVHNKKQFLGSIKESVLDSICECYLYVDCLEGN